MQEIILKARYFERGLSKSLKKGNFIFSFTPSPFQQTKLSKTKEAWNQWPVTFHVTKQIQKNSFISYVLSVYYYLCIITQCLFFKKNHSRLYLLILLKKEYISFHFLLIPSPTFKGAMKLYFMHYLVTISFNMGLYKALFSTDSFGNLVFVFFMLFYIVSNWIQCNLNKLYNICIA